MKKLRINQAEHLAMMFLSKIKDVKESDINKHVFESNDVSTTASKETGALKRASLELTRALSKMRIDTY